MGSVCAHLCCLQLIFQIDQCSNWGKAWSIVLYKHCTNIWLTCIFCISKSKKIMKFQKCYQLSKTCKLLKIWSTREFSSVATLLPGLKPGEGVPPSGIQTLPYHLGNMHNLASKNREDTTLQTLLTVKQTIELLHLTTGSWSLVWTLETNSSWALEFFKLCTLVEQNIRNTLYFGSMV
jgi:hypothetical protein